MVIRERAPAKVNLLLHVGPRRRDGLHELCSLFASIDLVDDVLVAPSDGAWDTVVCGEVPGPNLCATALGVLRSALADGWRALPPLEVRIDKRIPVAAGLGGGSADAGAVLRAANEIAGGALDRAELRQVAAEVGADVPSQVDPAHALVRGAGEVVEPIALPGMWLVLVPSGEGLATGAVYDEADRISATRERLDPDAVRELAAKPLDALAAGLRNDLEAAAVSLRPELRNVIEGLERAGALTALVTGSGPTVFGVFAGRSRAERAAREFPGALVASPA